MELPVRHPALDPGPGGRRLRVPARLRRRELQRGQTFSSPTGSPIPRERYWPRTSACPSGVRQHPDRREQERYIFQADVPGPLASDGSRRPGPVPRTFSTVCSPRSRSAPGRNGPHLGLDQRSRSRRRSPPRSSKSSPAGCASCTVSAAACGGPRRPGRGRRCRRVPDLPGAFVRTGPAARRHAGRRRDGPSDPCLGSPARATR